MKILLVSDTHGDNKSLNILLKKYPNMDLYIHCGDSESDTQTLHPFISVRGNCDWHNFNEYLSIQTPRGFMVIQHKPTGYYDLIKKYSARYFIHGHTHVRRDENNDLIRIINPGAISFSRDGFNGSYAIFDITKESETLSFYSLEEKN